MIKSKHKLWKFSFWSRQENIVNLGTCGTKFFKDLHYLLSSWCHYELNFRVFG